MVLEKFLRVTENHERIKSDPETEYEEIEVEVTDSESDQARIIKFYNLFIYKKLFIASKDQFFTIAHAGKCTILVNRHFNNNCNLFLWKNFWQPFERYQISHLFSGLLKKLSKNSDFVISSLQDEEIHNVETKLENSDHSSKSFSNKSIQSVINLAPKSEETVEITEDDQEIGKQLVTVDRSRKKAGFRVQN